MATRTLMTPEDQPLLVQSRVGQQTSRVALIGATLGLLAVGFVAVATAGARRKVQETDVNAMVGLGDAKYKDKDFEGHGLGTCCHIHEHDHTTTGKNSATVEHMALEKCHDHCASMKTCFAFEHCKGCSDHERCEFHHKPIVNFDCVKSKYVDPSKFQCYVKKHVPTITFTTTTTTTTTTRSAIQCYQCGNFDGNGNIDKPCTVVELLTGKPKNCPSDKHFCMIDIAIAGGKKSVVKRCVDEPTCHEDWLELTSDKGQCVEMNPISPPSDGINCHFCCTKDNCNKGYKPDMKTVYDP